jgi:hypothetical protein
MAIENWRSQDARFAAQAVPEGLMAQSDTPQDEDEPWWRVGIAPDEPRYLPPDVRQGTGFTRYVVEFDDQGASYRNDQLVELSQVLDALEGQHPIVLVFVHGWKHNARRQDRNLDSFDRVLAQTAQAEQALKSDAPKRPVVGIFVGWRGLSFYAGWLTNLTFWNRRTAALRVALGSIRELFGRLRVFRQRQDPESVLVISGHSFGGLIVYSALAQSLVELATFSNSEHVEPSFANLVLLVNPAFEAARYLPVHAIVADRKFLKQPPALISVTAENDWATGFAFPLGARLGSLWEHARTKPQKEAVVHTIGHIAWMCTHRLTAAADANAGVSAEPSMEQLAAERQWSDQDYLERREGWKRHFADGAVLTHVAKDPSNPFWVVEASRDVVDGHNGIFRPIFLSFIRKVVAEQLRTPAAAGGAVPRPACYSRPHEG